MDWEKYYTKDFIKNKLDEVTNILRCKFCGFYLNASCDPEFFEEHLIQDHAKRRCYEMALEDMLNKENNNE